MSTDTPGPQVHEHGLCESPRVGDRTTIWAFTHVLAGAVIGAECNLCDHVFVENDVVVGDRVTVKSGVQLWDGVRLGDDVFVGPNATFTNDLFPRSKQRPERFVETVVAAGASIGANATILAGVMIGAGAMVGAGAVVTRDVPARAIVVGNPARIVGYDTGSRIEVADSGDVVDAPVVGRQRVGVGDAEMWTLPNARDMRGSLAVADFANDLPFEPRRAFTVFDVPGERVRGEHAHRTCEQFLVAVSGAVTVLVDNGADRATVVLDRPDVGLYMPAMLWGTQCNFSADSVLLVFASEPYDDADYIRTYDDFIASTD